MYGDSLTISTRTRSPEVHGRADTGPTARRIDLATLDSDTLIAPRETGRKLFVIKTTDSLQLYADFEDFVIALTDSLVGGSAARSMYARGHYNADTNEFTAYKIFVYILEP